MDYKNSYQSSGYESIDDPSSVPPYPSAPSYPPPNDQKLEYKPLIASTNADVYPVYQPAHGEHFTYVCPVTYQKHHAVLVEDRLIVEFEDTRKRDYRCWSTFVNNCTHVGIKLQWRKWRFQGSLWTSLSFFCVLMILTTFILSWIGVSERDTTLVRVACGFGIANFLMMFVITPYIIKNNGIGIQPIQPIATILYALGLFLMLGVFICSCGFMSRSNQYGQGTSFYFNYITCKEGSLNPNNYAYLSLCDSGTFGWVQSLILLSFLACVCLGLAHFFYFGQCLPFWFDDVTDKTNNPCDIKFFGPAVAGLPASVTLARKDSERLVEAFYEKLDRKAAPKIGHKVVSSNWWGLR